ncbi:dihydropteroate synthase [Algivirga pacifica]|uniref:Dihydropteroate synthase n=1 Tax=Algivirga pacifica TaxID=1162670 RepID=A0ABP9D6C9_9BACT
MYKFNEFTERKTICIQGKLVSLEVPKVMGILNVTPDSFYDGGKHAHIDYAFQQAQKMLEEGADILDIGGYSSRPGAEDISVEEEKKRVLPIIKTLSEAFPQALISIDTFRSEVAEAAIQQGAHIVNDISGGQLDQQMLEVVAGLQVPYIMMHMRGTPQTMQQKTQYSDLVGELLDFFHQQADKFLAAGGKDIIIDPGFGFAKTVEQNYQLLHCLGELRILNYPILAGLSRKSMIYKKLDITPAEALNGTTVLNTIAIQNGASLLRVHDVKEAKQVIQLLRE